MDKGEYPSVFVVDSHATRPPVPPRLVQRRKRAGVAQTMLFLLVSVALCGLAIEACLIYRLHQHESSTSASSSKLISDKDQSSTDMSSPIIGPSKPLAHLTVSFPMRQNGTHESKIMTWNRDAISTIYDMDYKNGSLIIQKEGFYYVYSKVSFQDTSVFRHSIHLDTKLYLGKSIPLLMSRKYSLTHGTSQQQSNSYLGGVFHLHKDDAVFVKVSHTLKVLQQHSYENIFGAYML